MITLTLPRLQAEALLALSPNQDAAVTRIAVRGLRARLVEAIIREDASRVATDTADAYSHDRYGAAAWLVLTTRLLKSGLTPLQVEAILRSKWTRWAADQCGAKPTKVAAYLAKHLTPREIDALVEGTFP